MTSPYPVKVQAGALDSIGDIQIDYKETALEFGGDQAVTSELVGGSANKDATLTLTCPTGLRFDVVEFASYGRPTFGNPTTTTESFATRAGGDHPHPSVAHFAKNGEGGDGDRDEDSNGENEEKASTSDDSAAMRLPAAHSMTSPPARRSDSRPQ